MAGRVDELDVAAACEPVAVGERPLSETTESEVLAEKDVKRGVDGLERGVTDKNEPSEAVEDHADLHGGVPTVVAGFRREGSVEARTAAGRAGFKQTCTVGAVGSGPGL